MTCPKCGYEIPEGMLLCEKCGTEINIVPEFDIEVENSISETLSSLVYEIHPKESHKEKKSDVHDEADEIDEFFKEPSEKFNIKLSRKNISLFALICVVFFSLFVGISLFAYTNYSVGYQQRQAKKYLEEKNYDKAIHYIDKGIKINPSDKKLLYDKANIYYEAGNFDKAKGLLISGINDLNIDKNLKERYFDLLLKCFGDDYTGFNEVLLNADSDIQLAFNEFLALPPEFSVPTGNYSAQTSLVLSANAKGDIYFSIDGSDPDTNSSKYIGPILLEHGDYEIKAVFINSYGVKSAVSNSYYLIDVDIPDPPTVSPESGEYVQPFSIMADASSKEFDVYYTIDNPNPTVEDGILYEEPFNPAIGYHNYSFICVSADGVCSEAINRSYDFNLQTNMDKNDAPQYLLQALFVSGQISDLNGKAVGYEGTYSYLFDSIIEISDLGYYYRLCEFFADKSGVKKKTDNLYAVNPYNGECYRLLTDAMGNYGLVPLQ